MEDPRPGQRPSRGNGMDLCALCRGRLHPPRLLRNVAGWERNHRRRVHRPRPRRLPPKRRHPHRGDHDDNHWIYTRSRRSLPCSPSTASAISRSSSIILSKSLTQPIAILPAFAPPPSRYNATPASLDAFAGQAIPTGNVVLGLHLLLRPGGVTDAGHEGVHFASRHVPHH